MNLVCRGSDDTDDLHALALPGEHVYPTLVSRIGTTGHARMQV
jgi:hypothetical protein